VVNFNNNYISRINMVLDYIDKNIACNFTLLELSKIACFSKFHFHRIFYSIVGETLFHYIQRIRLEKSAYLLAGNSGLTITEIAFQCGFTGSAIFSRNFKIYFNMSPSEWKKKSNSLTSKINNQGYQSIKNEITDYSRYIEYTPNSIVWKITDGEKRYFVEVKDFPETTAAYIRYVGSYKGDSQLFNNLYGKLLTWAVPRNVINERTFYFNIYHDNPEITDDGRLRLSVCINVPADTEVSGEVGKMVIPSGKYCFAKFDLGEKDYQEAWDWVYSKWLPQSGYQPDEGFPFELIKGNSFSGDKHEVDICIPVKPI
jgi:AraC family transcriptional regulator